MATGPTNTIMDVPGLAVGQAQDPAIRTGVSIILPDSAAVTVAEVRGGGPGTRELAALDPLNLVGRADAIVLAGGSVYGLAAADRVAARLGAAGRGFALVPQPGVPVSPIVPAAILYDLANGGDKAWGDAPPYQALADAALDRISEPLALGPVGAGAGARAGAYPGGVGSASAALGASVVGAFVAVNSFGSPYVPGTDRFWAAPFEIDDEFGGRGVAARSVHGLPPDTKLGSGPGQNTTIAVVATDLPLTRVEAARVAIMAHDGMARALRPVHGPTDGDTIFVVSTGHAAAEGQGPLELTRIGNAAADVLARAIARGVYLSEPDVR
jgi:L-aminopeptidase/D-esterase-like protein